MSSFARQARDAFFHPSYGWKTTHFWGPVANWGIVLAGVYDMSKKGPEVVSLPMTTTLCAYSALFMRFAWKVSPRNYLLFACHLFNVGVQVTQLGRRITYDQEQAKLGTGNSAAQKPSSFSMTNVAGAFAAATAIGIAGAKSKSQILKLPVWTPSVKTLLEHPAGPFTIFFWAPTMKWGLSVANIIDYKRPVDNLSIPQQTALCLTGAIWTRYSFVINPINYNLALVNFALMLTGMYQLTRRLIYDPFEEENKKK